MRHDAGLPGCICRLRPVLALARPVSQRAAIGSHDCEPASLIRSNLQCGCGRLLFSAAGRGSNAETRQANDPGLIQAYAVRTARSALRLQRRAIRTATVFGHELIGFALGPYWQESAIGSHDTAPAPLIKGKLRCGWGGWLSLFAARCRSNAEMGQTSRPGDLGGGRPHRLKRPAPGASDPQGGDGVRP